MAAEPVSDVPDGRTAGAGCPRASGKADAAAALFPDLAATAPMNGAKSPDKTDWSPVKGRGVVVWPDHDGPAGSSPSRSPGWRTRPARPRSGSSPSRTASPRSGTSADPPPEGETATLRALLDEAEAWSPTPKAQVGPGRSTRPASGRAASWSCARRPDAAGRAPRAGRLPAGRGQGAGRGEKVDDLVLVLLAARGRGRDPRRRRRAVGPPAPGHRPRRHRARVGDADGPARRRRRGLPRAPARSLGLELAPGRAARDALHEYVTMWRPAARVRCVDRTGWHGGVFVLPDAAFGDAAGEASSSRRRGRPRPTRSPARSTAGARGGPRYAVGNSRLVLGSRPPSPARLLAPARRRERRFPPRRRLLDRQDHGAALRRLGLGPRGPPWRTTDNAAEVLARGASDALLCLDEVSQADGRAVDAIVYMLGNGTGRRACSRDATARAGSPGGVLFLSTGETGLAAKMQEAGRRARAGQEVRLVEVPADAGRGPRHLRGAARVHVRRRAGAAPQARGRAAQGPRRARVPGRDRGRPRAPPRRWRRGGTPGSGPTCRRARTGRCPGWRGASGWSRRPASWRPRSASCEPARWRGRGRKVGHATPAICAWAWAGSRSRARSDGAGGCRRLPCLEDRPPGRLPGREVGAVPSSVSRLPQKDSMGALSQQSPSRLTDCGRRAGRGSPGSPCTRTAPAVGVWISPGGGCRRCRAIRKASHASSARRWSAMPSHDLARGQVLDRGEVGQPSPVGCS